MRALFVVSDASWSGSARIFVAAARGLAARGYQVTAVCQPETAVEQRLASSGVETIPVELDGILRVEHSPHQDGTARLRVFFLGHPLDDRPPKQRPDNESLGAAWVSLNELSDYPLRGDEVRAAIEYVRRGGTGHPLSLLCQEGAHWAAGG